MNIRKTIGTRSGATVVVMMVAAAAALGLAVAANIPNANGVIHGCYKENNGQLRLVERAADCTNNERHIKWNQAGNDGPVGPQGPQGATGPQGSQGQTGAAGSQGPAGPQGSAGPQGPAGPSNSGPSGSAAETFPFPQPHPPHFFVTCNGPSEPLIDIPVTLTSPSTINVYANAFPGLSSLNSFESWVVARAQLLSGATVVASRDGGIVQMVQQPQYDSNSESVVAGPLLANSSTIYVAPAGSYVLRLILTDRSSTQCGLQGYSHGQALMSYQAFSSN